MYRFLKLAQISILKKSPLDLNLRLQLQII